MFENIVFAYQQKADAISQKELMNLSEEYKAELESWQFDATANSAFILTGNMKSTTPTPLPEIYKDNCSHIVSFSYMEMNSDYYTHRVGYDSILLLYTYQGRGILHYCGNDYSLMPDTLFIIDCKKEHTYYSDNTNWVHSDLHIGGGNLQFLYDVYFAETPVIHFSSKNDYQRMLEKVLISDQTFDLRRPLYVDVQISRLIFYISKEFEKTNAVLSPPETLTKLAAYLNDNYVKELSLDDLSNYCGLSKYHLLREFKKYFGFTPHDYINELRISNAKMFLQNTDLAAYKIGQIVGISNEASFIRLFKKKTGETPGIFRKNP